MECHINKKKCIFTFKIYNVSNNPAELSNLSSKYEVNLFSVSTIVSNNIVGFNDIVDGGNLEDLLFKGNGRVNFRFDSEIYGPGFAMRLKKWSFGPQEVRPLFNQENLHQ